MKPTRRIHIALIVFGLFLIIFAPYIFKINPNFKDYKFEIESQDKEAIVNNLHYEFNFDKKEVVLNFSIFMKENDVFIVDYPLTLEFIQLSIIDETTSLRNNLDYEFELRNQSNGDDIYRKFLVVKPFRNLTWEDIGIIFRGNIYPEGRFSFATYTKFVRDAYVGDNPPGIRKERVNFDLGDYTCEAPCVSNTFLWQENFGYFIVPSKKGQNVKIVYKGDIEQKTTSLILNTFNEKNKNFRDIVIAFGIALLSGGLIGFSTSIRSTNRRNP